MSNSFAKTKASLQAAETKWKIVQSLHKQSVETRALFENLERHIEGLANGLEGNPSNLSCRKIFLK